MSASETVDPFGPFDTDHPPPLAFDGWTEISARLLQRDTDEQLEILNTHKIDGELWDACNLFWLQEIAGQLLRGNDKMASRYGTRCAEELKARVHTRNAPPVESTEPDVDATAFMTALHDETALPFASPLASAPLP